MDLDRWGELFEAISGSCHDPRTHVPLNVFVHERQARITRGGARPGGGEPLIASPFVRDIQMPFTPVETGLCLHADGMAMLPGSRGAVVGCGR